MEIENPVQQQQIKPVKNASNLPWIEKYRPPSFDELISHDSIVSTLMKFIDEKRLPNLLFYGPPGTGKTSTIIASARKLYGNSFNSMVLELNASDERGIQVVREQIKNFASMQNISFSSQSKLAKLIILDEADSMTRAAQMALRRIMEKYAKNTRFCIICNYQSKIIPALQSRCTRFKFKQIPQKDAESRVRYICEQEQLKVKENAISSIFQLCDGDMRKIVNMLQSLSISVMGSPEITEIDQNYIYKLTGKASPADIDKILDILFQDDIESAFEKIKAIKIQQGIDLQIIIKEISFKLIDIDLPCYMKIFITKRLSEIEYRLSINCDEKIQLASLISAIVEARHLKQ